MLRDNRTGESPLNTLSLTQARDTPNLSPTEKRVCALLLQRMTERRIASQLERSPNTVHVHVRNIYRKLGVSKRKQLLDYPGIVHMVVS